MNFEDGHMWYKYVDKWHKNILGFTWTGTSWVFVRWGFLEKLDGPPEKYMMRCHDGLYELPQIAEWTENPPTTDHTQLAP